jgi:hypothetical protein
VTIGAGDLESWAQGEEAAKAFPVLKETHEGKFTFHRWPDGRLRRNRVEDRPIEELVLPQGYAAELPGMQAAREAILGAAQGGVSQRPPPACFRMLSQHNPKLWKEGDAAAAAETVFAMPGASSSHEKAVYRRLRQLQAAGLVTLRGDPQRDKKVVVRAAEAIRPLLAKHGDCLPLGKVRVEVVGVLKDEQPGVRQRFKARHVVERPAGWIGRVKKNEMPPDLAFVLRHGQPFEGTTLKGQHGWLAASMTDLRPVAIPPSLRAVGLSREWRSNATEALLAGAAAASHEVHVVEAYGGETAGRVDVVAKKSKLPILLVLSGYDPILWQLKPQPGAQIDAVLAIGYYEQRVAGLPPRIPVLAVHSATNLAETSVADVFAALGVQPASVQKIGGSLPVLVGGQQ